MLDGRQRFDDDGGLRKASAPPYGTPEHLVWTLHLDNSKRGGVYFGSTIRYPSFKIASSVSRAVARSYSFSDSGSSA